MSGPGRSLALSEADEAAHEGHGAHRWMVSYADFMTLLLVFFVALYALSTQRHARREATAAVPTTAPQAAVAPPVLPAPEAPAPEATAPVTPAPAAPPDPTARRDAVLAGLQARLQPLVDAGQLRLALHGQGIALEIPEDALFASAEAAPSPRAKGVLESLARVLADSPYGIRVEGHTDNRRMSSSQFPSNWELSAARAAAVVRALQQEGLAADRLSAMGLADTRPKADNLTEQGRALNRRVDLVLLDN
ncbi:MAG: OmpA family protein [Burkholderiales bacterium]|nr:OmpA family protein [Burkholderiales bacterium]